MVPYHLHPQSAEVLLRPIIDSLSGLEARLSHYVDRIPMPEADRQTVAQVLEIVARARSQALELQQNGQ